MPWLGSRAACYVVQHPPCCQVILWYPIYLTQTPSTPSLQLLTSSRVSGPLVTSFSMVAGGDTRKAEVAIARRGWQLLRGMPTPVTQDLAVLWQDATAGKQADESAQLGRLLQHYHKVGG